MATTKELILLQLQLNGQKQVQGGLDKTTKSTDKLGRTAQTAGTRASRSFAGITSKALKMGAGVVGAYASIAGAKNAINATETLAKSTLTVRNSFGFATHAASQWVAVVQSRGADGKQLSMGFKTLAAASDTATHGGKAQIKTFARLGITQKELARSGGSVPKMLRLVSEGLGNVKSKSEKSALASKLFGKSWQIIAPLIRGGTKEMDRNLALADKYGATFGDKGVGAVEKFIKAQRESKLATLGLQVAFGTQVAPALTLVIGKVTEFVAQMRNGTGAGGKFAAAVKSIVTPTGTLVGLLAKNKDLLISLAAGLGTYIVLTKAWAVTTAVAAFATGGWVGAFWALNAAMTANPVGAVIVGVAALAAGLIYAYKHSEKFRNVVNTVWGAMKTGFDWIKGHWPLLLSILTGPFGAAGIYIARHFSQIVGVVRNALNSVIDILNTASGAVTSVLNAISPGSPFSRATMGHIRGGGSSARKQNSSAIAQANAVAGSIRGARARGGPVSAGSSYLVNERGQEIFTPRRSGYIHDAKTSAAMISGGGTDPGLMAMLARLCAALENHETVLRIDDKVAARTMANRLGFEAAFGSS